MELYLVEEEDSGCNIANKASLLVGSDVDLPTYVISPKHRAQFEAMEGEVKVSDATSYLESKKRKRIALKAIKQVQNFVEDKQHELGGMC